MAESPSRQQPSLLRRRAEPSGGGIVASMSEPVRASFDDPPRRGLLRAPARAGALRNMFFLSTFLVATRKMVARRARPGQSPPTEARHQAKRRTGPRPAPGRRIVTDRHAHGKHPASNGQAGSSPFCGAERSREQELSRRCRAREGEFRRDRRPEGKPALRQGRFFIHLSLSPQEDGRPPGAAITANRKHVTINTPKTKALDPGLRRGDESLPDARARQRRPSQHLAGAGNGEAEMSAALSEPAGGNCRVDV